MNKALFGTFLAVLFTCSLAIAQVSVTKNTECGCSLLAMDIPPY